MSNNKLFRLSLVFIMFFAAAYFTLAPTIQAQMSCSSPFQLSNGLSEYLYDIAGNLVVWVQDGEGDSDIWMHDLSTHITRPLTVNDTHEDGFAVKNGVIVLSIQMPGSDEVFLYNPVTHVSTRITNNDVEEQGLYTDGLSVVWHQMDDFDNEIYRYNIATAVTTQLTNNDIDDYNPMVSANYVLWTGYNGIDSEIYQYDLNTGMTTQIYDVENGEGALHDVDGMGAVWTSYDYDTGGSEVYYYNLSSGVLTQLSDNDLEDDGPLIDGRYITWEHYDGNDSEIMLYDIYTGITQQITDNNGNDWNSSVSGDYLVWEGYNGSDYDIFGINLTNNSPLPLVNTSLWDGSPRVENGHVIWQSGILFDPYQGDVAELFYMDCSGGGTNPTPEVTPAPDAEMVRNSGFEAKSSGSSAILAPWTVKEGHRDVVSCNRPRKTLARSGDCAFLFRGSLDKTAKLIQQIDLTHRSFLAGDTLNLSLYVSASNPTASGKIRLRVVYGDGTTAKRLSHHIMPTTGYQQVNFPYTLTSSSVVSIRIWVMNTSPSGKLYIDDVSLQNTPGSGSGSLMVPLPLPQN